MLNTPLKITDLVALVDAVIPRFQEVWKEGEENERYKKASHWSETQRKAIESQDRIPYSLGISQHKLNLFTAQQRVNRTSWKVEATEDPADEIKAEIASLQLRDTENRSGMKYLESDVFDSGVGVKFGVYKLNVTKDNNLRDCIKIDEVDYRNFIWDINATDYELNKSLFMAEKRNLYRKQVEEEYGKEAANRTNADYEVWGREKLKFWISSSGDTNNPYDVLTVIDLYLQVNRKYHCVIFNGEKVAQEKSKADAEDILKDLKFPYLISGEEVPPYEIVEHTEPGFDRYTFTYSDILEYEETDLEYFPYSIYRAFHFKDQFWSLMDVLKSPQQWFDRLMMQVDYAFGVDIKNGWEIVTKQLAEGMTFEQAVQNLKDGVPVAVQQAGAVNAIEPKGANPQWMQMASVLKEIVEDIAGGRSFQGLSEGSGESGVSVREKKQMGEMVSMLFIDNLQRCKRDLGMKTLSMQKKYDTAERVIKVSGAHLTPDIIQVLEEKGLYKRSHFRGKTDGFVTVNGELEGERIGLAYLKDASYELKIVEDNLSESRRERKQLQLLAAAKIDPSIINSPKYQELLYSTFDMDHADKLALIEERQRMAEGEAIMNQQQLNIEKAKVINQMPQKVENKEDNKKSSKSKK